MAGLGVGALGGAGGVLAAEVCAPLLLLCWLCCWPDDDRSGNTNNYYCKHTFLMALLFIKTVSCI